MNIVVIGTGYVGLVSGTCFAEMGFNVTCVDKIEDKINKLKENIIPIYEPGLEEMVARNVTAGRITFTTDLAAALKDADIVSIAVGTPTRKLDGYADLTYVFDAAKEIATALDHYAVIVTKSTVPAGTGYKIREIIQRTNPSLEFDIASNPEFLREGNAITDFMEPDRVVCGTESTRAREHMAKLYAPLAKAGAEIIHTDIISSELIKYAANTFLATKVSFINEMADLCEKVGGNITDVAYGMGTDQRIGNKFLQPGPGYGGSCFPKDTTAMVNIGERALSPITIVDAVVKVNRARPHRMVAKIIDAAGGDIEGKKIAFLGLTFKPNTDDVRDSIAILVADELARSGATVVAYDPKGMDEAKEVIGQTVTYATDTDEALQDADVMVLATEWSEFCALSPDTLRSKLKQPIVVDLRNAYDPAAMQQAGFDYISIGRAPVFAYSGEQAALARQTKTA